jgi:hypothetical protein
MAVASYPFPRDPRPNGCRPQGTLAAVQPAGAVIFLIEYERFAPSRFRPGDFPPRPRPFRLSGFARYECFGPSFMLRFRQEGRFFQIHVALGRRATAATRATVLRVLDSLRVERP